MNKSHLVLNLSGTLDSPKFRDELIKFGYLKTSDNHVLTEMPHQEKHLRILFSRHLTNKSGEDVLYDMVKSMNRKICINTIMLDNKRHGWIVLYDQAMTDGMFLSFRNEESYFLSFKYKTNRVVHPPNVDVLTSYIEFMENKNVKPTGVKVSKSSELLWSIT
jgi:hypothetical protein